jgi:hypothetical protein
MSIGKLKLRHHARHRRVLWSGLEAVICFIGRWLFAGDGQGLPLPLGKGPGDGVFSMFVTVPF